MVVVAMEARSREQTSTSLKQLIESATELSSSWIHHHPDLHVEPTPPRALHPIISTPRQVYYPAWSFDFLPPRQPHPRSQSHAACRHRRRHHHRRRDPWLPVQLRHALPLPPISLFFFPISWLRRAQVAFHDNSVVVVAAAAIVAQFADDLIPSLSLSPLLKFLYANQITLQSKSGGYSFGTKS